MIEGGSNLISDIIKESGVTRYLVECEKNEEIEILKGQLAQLMPIFEAANALVISPDSEKKEKLAVLAELVCEVQK